MRHLPVLLALVLLGCPAPDDEPDYVPEVLGRCAAFEPLRKPLFGDTHIHTRLSLDANLQGTRMSPRQAYRFARGEEVGIHPFDAAGEPLRQVRLERPPAMEGRALSMVLIPSAQKGEERNSQRAQAGKAEGNNSNEKEELADAKT